MRTLAAGLLAAALASAHPAAARADGLAFWGYWHAQGGKWTFAATGPAQAHPANGAVEGWRFAKAAGNTGVPPRDRPAFGEICGSGAAPAGRKRVAVVIDYGDPADAPKGQRPPAAKRFCATVAQNAAAAQPIRKSGLPDDIAAAALYLASDDSLFVTGTHILVDGGITIGPRHAWDRTVRSPFEDITGMVSASRAS